MPGATLESDGNRRSAFALIASALAHAAVVLSVHGAVEIESSSVPVTNVWGTRSIEVGTLPEAARAAAPASEPLSPPDDSPPSHADAPASPPEAAAPAPEPSVREQAAEDAGPDAPATRAPGSARKPVKVPEPAARADASAAPPPRALGGADLAATSGGGAPSHDGGELGALGLPRGVRHFAAAFARALPAGTHADAAWSALPLGRVGNVAIEVRIDEAGRIADVRTDAAPSVPSVLTRMLDRALLLLRAGTFSLDPRRVTPGTERLEIEVTLSERDPSPDPTAEPKHLRAVGFGAPTRERPGFARFTLNSGRHMEALVRIVPTSAPE